MIKMLYIYTYTAPCCESLLSWNYINEESFLQRLLLHSGWCYDIEIPRTIVDFRVTFRTIIKLTVLLSLF